MVSGTMLLLGLLFYESSNPFLAYYFWGFGIISFLFYPLYQRKHYKNHYEKFIDDTYKNRVGITAEITFDDFAIHTTDVTGESRINLSELENVTETGDYFYLSLKTGGHLIVPKSKIGNVPELRVKLKELAGRLNIEFIEDLKWKWK